jgi:hypothetical protein
MDVALAQICAAFDNASAINAFKLRVERFLQLGPRAPAVRARFGARAEMMRGRSLETAVALAESWWRDERKAFQVASAMGRGNRLSVDVLSELRLILRMARFKQMQAEFSSIIAELSDQLTAVAAE